MSPSHRLLLAFSISLVQACVPAPALPPAGAAATAPTAAAADARAGLLMRADGAFARRAEIAQAQHAVTAWEQALGDREDRDLHLRLARARYFLGLASEGDARRAHFERGAEHALRAWWPAGASADECAAAQAHAEAAPLFWRAANLAELAREHGIVEGASARALAVCLAERAVALQPELFHGGPLRLLGRLLASLPALSGGDLARSRTLLEAAVARAPEFLQNRVDLAAYWAVKAQDRRAFESALRAVLAAPDGDAAIAPENALARRRAQALLERADVLF
ncbi:MAG: TRAP transporter TatT component family protein [Myxococcales bacterium]|jgi:hypothetical protein